ncbi:MAG: 2-isopropylmalate synthase [Pseudomonadales bacterium]|nr:2-isopropylmalate synthase [Pseudomonadales bacterium]MCP5173267.1 2-isopropylmalate synthase [Pseudomonadales bacterium]
MINNPNTKYRPFAPVQLSDRCWPNRTIEKPPVWMSTDLRDGNQSLIDPMSVETKLRFFEMLVEIGFKEIEVAFPAASDTDFNFVRRLITENRIPDDVTIEVLTQAREDLIKRTVESVIGARKAIVHLYNPTAPQFRRIVYNTDVAGVKAIAEQGTRWVKHYTSQHPETEWVYQYSPEIFSGTELPVAREVCDAVSAIWQPTPEHKMIINLPATVEMATPNIYADQVEWMDRNLARRDSILISVHPHNDRGTAVAAAELAIMAGADRVEGCLFGNGERTGNVDIVTLALNLYTQGIHPGLDFSKIEPIRRTVEECNQIPVHPRHPYAGELVFTAFSGSHQDAIKKGFAQQNNGEIWEVPYLPIDPADLNRGYEAVVRVNSQSGKGGVAFLLQQQYGLELPRRLQIEFSRVVKQFTDREGCEATSADIFNLFEKEYLQACSPYRFSEASVITHSHGESGATEVQIRYQNNGKAHTVSGIGNGSIDAVVKAMGNHINVIDYHEHAMSVGASAEAVCYIEMQIDDSPAIFGVGIHHNIVSAAIKAIFNGLNRQSIIQGAIAQEEHTERLSSG